VSPEDIDRQQPVTGRARRGRAVSCVLALGALGVLLGSAACSSSHAAPRPAAASPRATESGCTATAGSPCATGPGPAGVAVAVPPAQATVPRGPFGTGQSPPRFSGAPGTGPASPRSSSAAPPASPSSAGGTAAAQVLALVNQARSAAGLPALTVTAGLAASSSAHNQRMAAGCGLSHQCPGEPAIGARETAAGVHWTAAGENIGEGGPADGTPQAIAQMATSLIQAMLNEKPPDDGHRRNILSSSFTHIGIAVYRDSSGTVWLTQDFSN
jgi:uncharacterized protein YkwD